MIDTDSPFVISGYSLQLELGVSQAAYDGTLSPADEWLLGLQSSDIDDILLQIYGHNPQIEDGWDALRQVVINALYDVYDAISGKRKNDYSTK